MIFRLLNQYIDTPTFQQEGVNTASQVVAPSDDLITFDLKNGFYHVPVHADHRTYLGFEIDKKYFVYSVSYPLVCVAARTTLIK